MNLEFSFEISAIFNRSFSFELKRDVRFKLLIGRKRRIFEQRDIYYIADDSSTISENAYEPHGGRYNS